MTIEYSTIIAEIKRHLSMIGKRVNAKDGTNLFSNITTSTLEDPLFTQYIKAGIQNVVAVIRPLVRIYFPTSTSTTLIIGKSAAGGTEDERCGETVVTYLTLFTVGEYLAKTHPELAGNYQTDAANAMQTVVTFCFHKGTPPPSSYSYKDVTGGEDKEDETDETDEISNT